MPFWLCAGSILLLVHHAAADLSYEELYATKLRKHAADEIVDEPLLKLGVGSCQKVDLDLKRVYDTIVRYDPDMFLFTGDVVYAGMSGDVFAKRAQLTGAVNLTVSRLSTISSRRQVLISNFPGQ